MTALAVGLVVAGVLLIWAGFTGADLAAAIRDTFAGGGGTAPAS